MDEPNLPASLARRFEAVMFDWDGTAVTDRSADAGAVRAAVEALCARGVDVAIVSGTHLENVDGQVAARPVGPGRLLMALNRGSELFEVGADGPRLVTRRQAMPEEDAALTRAAEQTVARLAARGLDTAIVSQRLNRRKIDLIPLPEWADPPKSQIDRLLAAVEERLRAAGLGTLADVAALATAIAREAGLADPRVTSDAKHVEIGLTDKADSARAVLAELWADGIAPDLLLIGGDEFGEVGGLRGSDSFMLVSGIANAGVCSVGIEPHGVPPGVEHIGGGPARFLEVLDDQVRRRRDLPRVVAIDGWSLAVDAFDPKTGHVHEELLAIADGVIGTNGAPLLSHSAASPGVLAAGVYDGDGPLTDLLCGPVWATLQGEVAATDSVRRVLDLRTGLLSESITDGKRLESVRFSSLARPGTAVLRADVDPPETSGALVAPEATAATSGVNGGHEWTATQGSGGSITAAAWQARDATRLDRIAAYVVGPDGPEPDRAVEHLSNARAAGFDVLAAEHRRAWARRWERADVRIAGDNELQQQVRLALFHMMASVADRGEAAVGARGLTGHAYRGHVFWDADLFVLPFLAATAPAAARAMLEYRSNRLAAALEIARAEGHRGARFPWESAGTGFDVTPRSAVDFSGHVVPIRTGEAEVHIVGAVAWAVGCYIDWTGDRAFAAGTGARIFVETARYWASRIRLDGSGRGHIYGVIGPDEYHEPVDDNAYTNVLARWNLRRAAATARGSDGLADREEINRWVELADALVDGLNPDTGLYEEFAGFFGLEPLLIRDVAPRRPVTADLLLGPERVHRSQVVKQTDVLMLHHLLPDEVAAGSLDVNLDYYEPRTAHGSSLSPGIHAALFARAGRIEEALAALRLASSIDVDDLTQTGAGGVHLGTMGSVWQALAYGFAGLRPRGDALVVDPILPEGWSQLELRVEFHGAPVELCFESDAMVVRARAPVTLIVDDRRFPCDVGETRLRMPARRPRGAPVWGSRTNG